MAEYIKRETFLKYIEERYCLPCKEAGKDYNGCKCKACWVDDMRGDVIDAPDAGVAPVVHGTWESRQGSWYCSTCGRGYKIKIGVVPACKYNYCPNCGARMDGDSDAKAD